VEELVCVVVELDIVVGVDTIVFGIDRCNGTWVQVTWSLVRVVRCNGKGIHWSGHVQWKW